MANYDKTKIKQRQVIIEEYFMEFNGKIYRYWRFEGQSNWHTNKTPLKILPYVLFEPNPELQRQFLQEMEDDKSS